MSKRPFVVTASAICLLAVLGLTALYAAAPASNDWNAIQIRYAEANLELAKARLRLAANQSETVGDSVSKETLNALQAGVLLAQAQLTELAKGDSANPFAPQIAVAESHLAALEAQHNASLEANKLSADAVSDLEMRRETAEVAVAKARLVALQSLAAQPPEVRMQWEINQLQDQVRALWARPLIED